MLPLTNKEKETCIVTFKQDYSTNAQKAVAGLTDKPEILFKNGSVHALHQSLVKKLEAKNVKMDIKKFDKEASEKRIKAARAKEKAKQALLN